MEAIEIIKGVILVIAAIAISSLVASIVPISSIKTSIGILVFFAILGIFVRNTKVEEGTAKIIRRWGGVVKVFIQWTGYRLTPEGDIEPVMPAKRPWYGGLRVWIGTPFDKVDKFKLRWHSVEEVEGKRVPVFHEEIKDCIMVRPDRYWIRMTKQETKDGQFPDIEYLIGMRSINPEKTRYKSPHNWVENALSQLQPLLRTYHRTKTLAELLNLQRDQIWEEIYTKNPEGQRVIDTVLRDEWGVKIDEKEIGIFDVIPPPIYQEALAAESKAKMEAKAKKAKAKVEAVGRAAEIMGTVIEAVVESTGMSKKKIREEFQKDPKTFYEKHKTIVDNVMTKLSMEERAYLRIETPGAEGALGDFLRLIGAWQRMPKGKAAKEGSKEEKKKRKFSLTQEEIKEVDEDIFKSAKETFTE
jgi:hypothetical protein